MYSVQYMFNRICQKTGRKTYHIISCYKCAAISVSVNMKRIQNNFYQEIGSYTFKFCNMNRFVCLIKSVKVLLFFQIILVLEVCLLNLKNLKIGHQKSLL